MLASVRQNLLKYLAGLTIASGVGLAFGQLEQVPGELFVEVLTDTDGPDWRPEDRTRLLQLLSQDQRAMVRVAVGDALAANPIPRGRGVTDVVQGLVRDQAPPVHSSGLQAWARCLEATPVVERIQTAAQWALSEHDAQRHAVAWALAGPMQLPAADVILTYLASDRAAQIRRTSLESVRKRFESQPELVRSVASLGANDRSRRVRKLARGMLAELVTAEV